MVLVLAVKHHKAPLSSTVAANRNRRVPFFLVGKWWRHSHRYEQLCCLTPSFQSLPPLDKHNPPLLSSRTDDWVLLPLISPASTWEQGRVYSKAGRSGSGSCWRCSRRQFFSQLEKCWLCVRRLLLAQPAEGKSERGELHVCVCGCGRGWVCVCGFSQGRASFPVCGWNPSFELFCLKLQTICLHIAVQPFTVHTSWWNQSVAFFPHQ